MFYSDTPITSQEKDQLGRTKFVKTFAQALLNLNVADDSQKIDTFSVGLYGEWGSGKTSFVNMVLEELEDLQQGFSEEDTYIVLQFEPWHFMDSAQLLRQFFTQLSSEFQSKKDKNKIKIGEMLEEYADAFEWASLIPVVGGSVATAGKMFSRNLGRRLQKGNRDDDVQKQKDAIVKMLQQQPQKILVVIDDVDRLSSEQIRLVFQLMASIANFPNTTYLVVFDKDIVVKALEKVQEGSGEDYLEKIIQMPIEIPAVHREKIHDIFYERIDEVIGQNKENSFKPDHWQEVFESCVDPFIRSLRDVNRLCNSVQFKMAGIGAEVDFTDMVAITGLELKLPRVYNWAKNNKLILTDESYALNGGMHFDQKPTQQDLYDKYKAELEEFFDGNHFVKEYDEEMAIAFLAKLFPYFGQKIGKNYAMVDKDTLRRNNQIAHPEKFDRYFDLDLDNIGIKKAEVLKTVDSMDAEELRTFILDCDKKGKSYELLDEICAIRFMLPLSRVKVLAQGILDSLEGLNDAKQNKVFTRDASRLAVNLIIDLVELLPEPERFDFLSEAIRNANAVSFSSVAYVINLIELAYGKLTADGKERDYEKLVSAEELGKLESMFVQKAKSLLQDQSLFDIPDYLRILLLLEHFAPDYIKDYLSEAFQDNSNILKYLSATVETWYGSSIRYAVREDYQKYITEDQILSAIEATKTTGELLSLSRQVQSMSAAFYLNHYEHEKFPEGIMQADVNELLFSWEEEAVRNSCKPKKE